MEISKKSSRTAKSDAWRIFADRLLESRSVYALRNTSGLLSAKGIDGSAAQPFWSTRERAEQMVAIMTHAASEVVAIEISLSEFLHSSLPALANDGVLIGLDWEFDKRGWVFDAVEVQGRLREMIHTRLN